MPTPPPAPRERRSTDQERPLAGADLLQGAECRFCFHEAEEVVDGEFGDVAEVRGVGGDGVGGEGAVAWGRGVEGRE